MKKPLKILSIDWKFFVDAYGEQMVQQFPSDTWNKVNSTMSDLDWAEKYAQFDDICNITASSELEEIIKYFKELSKKVNKADEECEAFVAEDHEQITKFIAEYLVSEKQTINVVHLDGDKNSWCNHIGKKFLKKESTLNSSVVHKISCKHSDASDFENIRTTHNSGKDVLASFINFYFNEECPDLIVICRNGYHTPPHLDSEFRKIIDGVNNVTYCVFGTDIYDRYSDDFINMVNEIKTEEKYDIIDGDEY